MLEQNSPPVTDAMQKSKALGDVHYCVARRGLTWLADSYSVTSTCLLRKKLTRAYMCEKLNKHVVSYASMTGIDDPRSSHL